MNEISQSMCASSFYRLLILPALVVLQSCTTSPTVVTRTVEVPVPVVQPIPKELLKECVLPPLKGGTLADALDWYESESLCAALFRNQIELIRAIQ